MKDIIISVDSTSHKVNFPDEFLGIGYENLQGNLIFQFDNNFIGGEARLDISIDCESGMIPNLTPYENGYILPIKSSLLTGSNVLMQLVIDETSLTQYSLTTDTEINPNKTYYEKVGNDYIIVENPVVGDISQYYEANTPVFKTDIFQLKVKDSINVQETIPEQYPTWINTLNTLIGTINQKLGLVDTALTEMNNLNINVSDKVDSEVTITFTDKQGNQKEVKINDGRGIVSILKTSTSGNIDTYTITYTDNTTSTFEVTNGIDGTDGRGIVSIEKTGTTGLIDTYTITYTDNTTSTFNVVNGKGIVSIEKTSTSGYVDTYTITYNDGTTSTYEVTNGEVSQAQLDALQDELNYYKTIVNALPKITGSGTSITLNNTADSILSNVLNPNTSQDGTPAPETPYEIHTISGDNTINIFGRNIIGLDTKQYKVGLKAGDKLTITNETSSSITFYCYTKYGDTTRNDYWGTASGLTKTITLAYDTEAIAWITAPVGKAWINKGTTALPYEPYQEQTAQLNLGNLEYSKIGNYKDQFIRTSGKNLFDKDNANILNASITMSNDIYTTSPSSNGKSLYISIKPNTAYTISKIESKRFWVGTSSDTPTTYSALLNGIFNNSATSITITSPSNANYLVVYYFLNGTDTLTEQQIRDSIMINEGDTALPYEPYGTDEWYLKKNIGKLVLDGTENWATNSIYNCYQLNMGYAINQHSVNSLSNLFVEKDAGLLGTQYGMYTKYTYNLLVGFPNSTLSDFKTFLGQNNMILYYVLNDNQIIYTPLNETLQSQLEYTCNQMLAYKGQTNIIQINNDLPIIIDSTALKDLTGL